MNGPRPVATVIDAHLYAEALDASPNDVPSHTSNGESMAWKIWLPPVL